MTDEALYRLFFEGEEEMAKTLMERYSEKLTLYLDGILHDMPEAEDMMVEAFAQIFRKQRPIRREKDFKAYLYKIGRILDVSLIMSGLVLAVGSGLWISCLSETNDTARIAALEGAASILTNGNSLGYIVTALLAFLLGSTVTILLYRFRKGRKKDDDELL